MTPRLHSCCTLPDTVLRFFHVSSSSSPPPRVFLCERNTPEHGATLNNVVALPRNQHRTNNDGLTKRAERQRDNERETEKQRLEFIERNGTDRG